MWQAMAFQGGSGVLSGIGAGLGGKKKKEGLEDATAEILLGAKKGREEAGRTYGRSKKLWKPWRQSAESAMSIMRDGLLSGEFQPGTFEFDYEKYTSSPDYQFAFNEGQKALERSAAARGKQFSGEQMKALQDYGQQAGYGMAYQRARDEFDLAERGKAQQLQNWRGFYQDTMPGMYQTDAASNRYGSALENYNMMEAQAKAAEQMGKGSIDANVLQQQFSLGSDAMQNASTMDFGRLKGGG